MAKQVDFPAREAYKLFHFFPKDTVLLQYLFKNNRIRLINQLIVRFQQYTVSMAQQAGLDTQNAAFFANFLAGGTVYAILDSYRRTDTIDTDIVRFLLNLDISPLFPGGDDA